MNVYEERRRKRDEEREAQERAQEEEIRRAAEERQRRDDAEAAKWMGAISVEEAGVGAEGEGEGGEAAAARFVAYVRERKMVSIEEVGGRGGCGAGDWGARAGARSARRFAVGCMGPCQRLHRGRAGGAQQTLGRCELRRERDPSPRAPPSRRPRRPPFSNRTHQKTVRPASPNRAAPNAPPSSRPSSASAAPRWWSGSPRWRRRAR